MLDGVELRFEVLSRDLRDRRRRIRIVHTESHALRGLRHVDRQPLRTLCGVDVKQDFNAVRFDRYLVLFGWAQGEFMVPVRVDIEMYRNPWLLLVRLTDGPCGGVAYGDLGESSLGRLQLEYPV